MVKKIIIIINSTLNKYTYDRFGVDLLQKNGFNVEIWDLTYLLHPQVKDMYETSDLFEWEHCSIFEEGDRDKFIERVEKLTADTFVIIGVRYNRERFFVYQAISKSKAKYAINGSNSLPTSEKNKWRKRISYFKKLRTILSRKIYEHVFQKIPYKWLGLKAASIFLASGENSIVKHGVPVDDKTEIIWAHNMDYDRYLIEREMPCAELPSAVFLDQCYPFHCDWIYQKITPCTDADSYFPRLTEFFNLVEEKYGVDVVVAAHPQSHYEKYPDYFEGRKCVKKQTIKLIKECQLVIAHDSTALNFANLFDKPVIFLIPPNLPKGHPTGPSIRSLASWFGKNPIAMGSYQNIDWDVEATVSKDHYRHYRQAFIKKPHSADIFFWQIIADRLKQGL